MYRGLCSSLPQLRYPRTLPNLSSSTISNELRTGWKRPTSTIGLNKSGFIDLAPGEGLLFFDNVFPLKTAAYDIRYYLARHDKQSIRSLIKSRYIPKSLAESGFTILDVFPRLKDGGAFVKFTAPNPDKVESTIAEYLKASNFRPWFSPFKRIKAYKVRGEPWLEDLYRFPSARLKVEFIGGGLNQEVVYALFRRYGKIADIISQTPASKDLPQSVIVQYLRMRSATAAKNCLHGYTVPEIEASFLGMDGGGVTFRVLYERAMKARWIRDWLVNHPRIVIPLVAALVAATTVAIFDPVRTWFVKAKVTGALNFRDNTYYNWLRRYTVGIFPLGKFVDMGDLWSVWDERKEQVEQLKSWLLETHETFIVVHGPRGSGKRGLVVDSVLSGRGNVLLIGCEPISESHGDSAAVAEIASQVGYWPLFSWFNTISGLLDLVAQGSIGSSAGFSQTLETQLDKILQTTGAALKAVALRDKRSAAKGQGLGDDEYLSAHPEKRPVVVIDNFLHMGGDSIIYQKLADWAALLISANIAHVIFLTDDTSFSKSLAKALPDRVFHSIHLGDASPESAKRFVLKHISDERGGAASEKMGGGLDNSIQALGGRLTDLEFLARRIKAGETPRQAVTEIVETSANEILKLYLLVHLDEPCRKKRSWTPEQAWHLIKMLAENEQLRYNQVLIHDLFRSAGEEALQGIEHAELITIVSKNGRPWSIKPGRPVYQAAFKRLLLDNALRARMDYNSLATLVKLETARVRDAEDELEKVAPLPNQPKARIAYLIAKIAKSQGLIEAREKSMEELKKVLNEQY